jgi:hypothetical protein
MVETILVVDDDQDVRFVAQQGLLACGYTVLETGDPQQAIRMSKDQTSHLLLTDLVMPIMKGTELADWIQAISPTTKVLLMSGYQTPDIAPTGRPFMAKPFSIDVLVEHVRQTLERPSLFARAAQSPPVRLKPP